MKPLLLLAWLLLASTLDAALRRFPEHNFAIEVPAEWTEIAAPVPPVVVAVQTPDQSRAVLVMAVEVPEKERHVFAADFRAGVTAGLKDKGCRVEPEQPLTIGDLPFITIPALRPDGMAFTSYIAGAGNRGYLVQVMAEPGLVNSDPELRGIVQSFRLLSPAKPLPTHAPPVRQPSRFAFFIGRIWGITLIASVLGLVIWFIYRTINKRRDRRAALHRDAEP